MKYIIRIFFFLSHFLLSNLQANITPPYPEVWGYDLSSYPAFRDDGGSISAYRLVDNDIGFLILIDYENDNSSSKNLIFESQKYLLLHFFTGQKEYLNFEQWKTYINKMRTNEISAAYEQTAVKFKDGSNIQFSSNNVPRLCLKPFFLHTHLIKQEIDGQEKHYLTLANYNIAHVWDDGAHCDFSSAPFFYSNLYNFSEKIIDLNDDTFLTYNKEGGSLILRLDKNLHTKFRSETILKLYDNNVITRNYHIVNYEKIATLREEASENRTLPFYQTINNQLLIWLQQNYSMQF